MRILKVEMPSVNDLVKVASVLGTADLTGFKRRIDYMPDGTKVYYQWNADTEKWEEELPSPDDPTV